MTAAAVTTSAGVSKGIYAAFGLSPLTRGTHALYEIFRTDNWFIPATAGNNTAATSVRTAATVYPRYRGEHCPLQVAPVEPVGLSPLPRGTRSFLSIKLYSLRFIPATAGNTSLPDPCRYFSSVYPRYRREHAGGKKGSQAVTGLSPLPRGTLLAWVMGLLSARFIPATAGNT